MLVNLSDVLLPARRNRYAVPHFDCVEDVFVRTILDTAEAEQAPVILAVLEHDLKGRGIHYIPGLVRAVAPTYSIPVVLHLDHAESFDLCRQAIEVGFTSVMFDGSQLPFEENVARTREVVEYAHARNVSVEAELGFVGGSELSGEVGAESRLTEPDQVVEFCHGAGCDALAVSIGTSHGIYVAEPKLNIERLAEISSVSPVPLVLHGGSGTPEDQLLTAIRNGISKINVYSDLRASFYRGLRASAVTQKRENPLPDEMFLPIREALAAEVRGKIGLFFRYPRAIDRIADKVMEALGHGGAAPVGA